MPEFSSIGKRSVNAKPNRISAAASVSGPVVEGDTASARTKKCPFCCEEILISARKCKHCGEFLSPAARRAAGLQPALRSVRRTDVKVPIREAVLCLLFCLPLGIIALVYASQADAKLRAGDTVGAATSAAIAKNVAAAGLVVGLFIGVLYLATR